MTIQQFTDLLMDLPKDVFIHSLKISVNDHYINFEDDITGNCLLELSRHA